MKQTVKTSDDSNVFELRCYSNLQLSKLYDVDVKTFRRWLKPFATEIGTRIGQFYNIRQVSVIIEKLGMPYTKMAA